MENFLEEIFGFSKNLEDLNNIEKIYEKFVVEKKRRKRKKDWKKLIEKCLNYSKRKNIERFS